MQQKRKESFAVKTSLKGDKIGESLATKKELLLALKVLFNSEIEKGCVIKIVFEISSS